MNPGPDGTTSLKTKYGVLGGLLFLCVLLFFQFFMENWMTQPSRTSPRPHAHAFNITRAFVISMNEPESRPLLRDLKTFMNIDSASIFPAINGSHALQQGTHELSLYTKYTMLVGRHDHMQLSNPSMLGCLLSHIEIWKMLTPGETVAVFEEDAYVDDLSSERFFTLSNDMARYPWDILMLINGQFIATGQWKPMGSAAITCGQNTTSVQRRFESSSPPKLSICTWFGTRGYLITYKGSRHLLKHAYPIQVQIDALIGLVAAFEPQFQMFWSKENIVHQKMFYVSKIWDACLKCYLPTDFWFYCILTVCMLLFFGHVFFKCKSFFFS